MPHTSVPVAEPVSSAELSVASVVAVRAGGAAACVAGAAGRVAAGAGLDGADGDGELLGVTVAVALGFGDMEPAEADGAGVVVVGSQAARHKAAAQATAASRERMEFMIRTVVFEMPAPGRSGWVVMFRFRPARPPGAVPYRT
ncbi:hypothetical protein SCATT_p15100 (plasmid) [Streptantibioticus cattleyicolor NRRL 8057 = DSM 46488]|uniref:Uncharacterized protein n=1 Tax=Streptantibioticus cattleyicolor (strain ATCC 35852 / DSM 46488 / JCM 4925 / NBRC 14057 / NRRL 8057) TaxID=1003195 RepID=G8XGQ4_STREN|nr:hypothetical protein SCATT_p15100 [Streptantibioticus cattleyicolor NRRL 8057 = DSM 46488]